ncbi:glycosyltransferase, partial [Lactobacillus reuteri]|uniref:glycosyltransferase n=1 Tax=Limosilactobacillus reuteri TaxID=1598 RepID=UPI001652798B
MIFVSVGTHEQPFNRLMQALDKLIMDGKIKEQVVIQGGYSTYIPQDATFYKLMDFDIMNDYMHRARIVITHGGPATIIMALQNEKIPIVVPRQKKFDEHINNHQVEFTKQMADRRGNII